MSSAPTDPVVSDTMDDDTVDGLSVEELRRSLRVMLRLTERLAAPTTAEDRARIVRLLAAKEGPLPNLSAMVDSALDERDRARAAADRLRRIDPKSYTLAIMDGRA